MGYLDDSDKKTVIIRNTLNKVSLKGYFKNAVYKQLKLKVELN